MKVIAKDFTIPKQYLKQYQVLLTKGKTTIFSCICYAKALYIVLFTELSTPLGEIILISADDESIKYPNSDCVSILASLPLFSYKDQIKFVTAAKTLNKAQFNKQISRLLHEVKQEKPSFEAKVNNSDLLSNFIVLAQKNNQRIVKQDGAFIICGLEDFQWYSYTRALSLNELRYRRNGKTLVVIVNDKRKIMKELATYGITQATLFPEIDDVAEYIKNKFNK